MFTVVDNQWRQGKWLNYKDEGPIRPGKPTHKFAVYDRMSGVLMGYIKWDCPWRQYVFLPLNCRIGFKLADELAAFLRDVTTAQREKRK